MKQDNLSNLNYLFGDESTCMVSNVILTGLAIFCTSHHNSARHSHGKLRLQKKCTRGKILTCRGAEGWHFGSCTRLRGRVPSSKTEMDFPVAFPLDQIHQPTALHHQKTRHTVSYIMQCHVMIFPSRFFRDLRDQLLYSAVTDVCANQTLIHNPAKKYYIFLPETMNIKENGNKPREM